MSADENDTRETDRMTKAVIFDMDGVIFDSERAVYNGWVELSRKYGFADLDEVYIKTIGLNYEATRELYLAHYGADFPYDRYRQEHRVEYRRRYGGGRLPLKPGIRELLDWLKGDGYATAVASSTRSGTVTEQIGDAGLGPLFDAVIGGEMVKESKPAPDIFLAAAARLGAAAEDTYVIEDSYNGIRAAHAGGFIPIMVPDMLPPDDEMREKARYIFPDLPAAQAFFQGLR